MCCTRVDVIFDRYIEHSIKHGAREQRARGQRGIKKQITGRNIKLPKNWRNLKFMDLADTKTSIALFLSEQLIQSVPGVGCDLVVSGGFLEEDRVVSSAGHDVTAL